MVALVVKIKAAQGKEKELEKHLRETSKWIRENEKTTLQFSVLRKAGEPTEFCLFERYKDRDAWQITHRSSTNYQEGRAKTAGLVAGPPEIIEYEVLEP